MDWPTKALRKTRAAKAVLSTIVLVAGVAVIGQQAAGASNEVTYTATQTIPVPPASTYGGSGGGDGWALAFSATQVFNVFHHQDTLTIACHQQSDASDCWSPETITDADGNDFATPGHPAMYFDSSNSRIYTFATRTSDDTGGVVCIDTTVAASNPDPFCGFTALTAVGDASNPGLSNISDFAKFGSRLFAFNYVSGAAVAAGTQNKLLCFDVSTHAACASQPFTADLPAGTMQSGTFPEPQLAGINGHVIFAATIDDNDYLGCFDPGTNGACGGSWPANLGSAGTYTSGYGAPFPLLSSNGTTIGICLPTGTDQCFGLNGASVTTPAGMPAVINASTPWDGQAFVLGPRVYLPTGNGDQVECYDASTDASCLNFPKSFENLGYLYTVNPDPQRPTCIWVNADSGSEQIQNFDAYTGGACGEGPIRVLASSFVVPSSTCEPTSYQSLKVDAPPRASYTSGTVGFQDSDANPIPGAPDRPLDGAGTADLTGLSLNTASGLPQFVITLNGAAADPGAVTVTLTWKGVYDPSCVRPGTTVTGLPTGNQPRLDGTALGLRLTPSGSVTTNGVTTSGPGELLLAFVQADGPATGTQSVRTVSGAGLTWTRAAWANLRGTGASEVWRAYAPATLSHATVTATFATPADGAISVESFTGAAHSIGAAHIASTAHGPATDTIRPTASNSLIVGGGLDLTSATKPVPASGQSLLSFVADHHAGDYYWTQAVAAPTTAGTPVTVRSALPSTDRWSMVAVEVTPGS